MQEYPIGKAVTIVLLLFVNALAAAAETALDETLGTTIRKRASEGEKRAKRLEKLFDRKRRCTTVLDFLRMATVFFCGVTYAMLMKVSVIPRLKAVLSVYRLSEVYRILILVLLTVAFLWLAELLTINLNYS